MVFGLTINKSRNKPLKIQKDPHHKQNQDKDSHTAHKNVDRQKQEGKSLGKKKDTSKNGKGFDGSDKLTILAEIRALLRSLAN